MVKLSNYELVPVPVHGRLETSPFGIVDVQVL
jgi:hypothetical protein